MSTFYSVLTATISIKGQQTKILAGDLVTDPGAIAALQAGSYPLIDSSVPNVAAFAAAVSKARYRGQNEDVCQAIMMQAMAEMIKAAADFNVGSKSMVTPLIDWLNTTGATPTVFAQEYAMPDLTAADVVVTVLGVKVGSTDTFRQDYRACYNRNGSAPTLNGSIIIGANPIGSGTLSTATATLVVSGNNVQVQVTGVAATDIDWSMTMQVQQVQ
jgi:hypothetical protein